MNLLVAGVERTMMHLKMLPGTVPPSRKTIWIEKVVTIAAEQAGIFYSSVDRDAHVVKGTKIGIVTDYLNNQLQEVFAPEAGTILFVRALPSLKKGDTIANIGVIK